MTRRASAIAAAELRVVQSRQDLHHALRRLRSTLPRAGLLFAAAASAAALGYLLARRGGIGAVAGALTTGLIRNGVAYLARRRMVR